MKKVLSILIAVVMLVSIVPLGSINASATTYSASSAVSFANSHWNDSVGLCAEFVSRCLAAGGISIPNSAYYSTSQQSYQNNSGTLGSYRNPYTCSAALLLYLSQNYPIITNPSSSQISVGDVVFMYGGSSGQWKDGHVGIVISISGGIPVYAAHNKATNTGKFSSSYPCTYVAKMNGTITTHKVNSSYGTNFTAYPKSKITAENIFDENHNTISSTAWIGTTDKCTIYEVYTDGCCKLSYPIDSGGSRTVYSKISLFNTDAPSKPTVYINGSDYCAIGSGHGITFTFDAPNADKVYLYIFKEQECIYEGEFAPVDSYTRYFDEPSHYSCYILAHNAGGDTTSDWKGWDVAARPSTPSLSIWGNTVDNSIHFTWQKTSGTTWYDLRIYDSTATNLLKYISNIYENSYALELPTGSYVARVTSVLDGYYECWTSSSDVGFTISDEPTVTPDKFGYYNGHIYELYYDKLTWEEAKYYCENYRGGHLLTINGESESEFLKNELLSSDLSGYLSGGVEESEGVWKWVTGEPFEYTNWCSGQPDNYTQNNPNGECYLEIYPDGSWNDYNYDNYTKGFICEIETEEFTPMNSVIYNGHIYELYNYNITYGEASNFCKWNGGSLVSIASEEEQNVVYSLMENSVCNIFAWLGATDSEKDGNWTWSDGTSFEYTNWNENQPDYWKNLETCLMMYKTSGLWNDINWDYPATNKDSFCFILEKDAPLPVLESISLFKEPLKTEYYIGEDFDSTGMVVQLKYSDGSSETVTSGFTCQYDFSTNGIKTVVVEYNGMSTKLSVTVKSSIPVITVENYIVTITHADYIKDMRYTLGEYTTTTEIRNAEGNVALDNGVVTTNTVDGKFVYTMPDGGMYSIWIRMKDGTNYVMPLDMTRFIPIVDIYGLKITVDGLYDIKDYFIAKGEFNSYNELKDNGYIVRVTPNKVADKHSYTYTVSEPGMHTVLVRYNDGSEYIFHEKLTVDEPIFITNGLQLTVGNLNGVKVIRTAYGEYNTPGEIKRAEGSRAFTAKNIKNSESYMIQYRNDGIVTVAVVYDNGYEVIYKHNVTKKTPIIEQNGNKVTFTKLDDLKVLRYAKGEFTTSSQIKAAPGSVALTSKKIINGCITVTLTPGTYTFCVQYDDESYNYYTVTVE